jgi:hypothetical protein
MDSLKLNYSNWSMKTVSYVTHQEYLKWEKEAKITVGQAAIVSIFHKSIKLREKFNRQL